ncbi:hypothetical protein J5N97_002202 [Dioscorea zingiberensis]|uniref:Uncharacterized protein n=1 Tax=Dioscorea zingiberensis TaxID=325984 RepID=A0A9D5D2A0_9LILI|nr:hypothetical protein J5N97_002202 [Dioscorea zingiberensis]
MGSSQTPQQLPLIDLSWLDPSQAEASGWDAARAAVMRALETFGCFEAIYDRITPELRASLFDEAMEEVFSLPLETKMGNNSDHPYGGFIGNLPGMAYESLRVDRAPALDGAQSFTRLMWPAGNPSFCNTVWSFAKHLLDLEQIVRRMILQSMGIERHLDSLTAELTNGLRLSKYWLSPCQGVESGMNSHTDPNFLTIICQHKVQGLEVKTRENTWISVMPLPNTFTVMLGEAFEPWTNGRLKAPVHRLNLGQNRSSLNSKTREFGLILP